MDCNERCAFLALQQSLPPQSLLDSVRLALVRLADRAEMRERGDDEKTSQITWPVDLRICIRRLLQTKAAGTGREHPTFVRVSNIAGRIILKGIEKNCDCMKCVHNHVLLSFPDDALRSLAFHVASLALAVVGGRTLLQSDPQFALVLAAMNGVQLQMLLDRDPEQVSCDL
jgi:hypothetical protein